MSSRYWCCLHKFASAAGISTCKMTPEWCSSHFVGKIRTFFSCFQIANTEDGNTLYIPPHSEVDWMFVWLFCFFFLKRRITSDHSTFITGKSFSRKYRSFFPHAHTKTQLIATTLPVIAIVFPNKTTISIHLPSLLTAKQTAYYCEGQENLDTFTCEAHHHFLISTESTSRFPLQPRTEMQQWSQTPDSSKMVHQFEMQGHRLITWDTVYMLCSYNACHILL